MPSVGIFAALIIVVVVFIVVGLRMTRRSGRPSLHEGKPVPVLPQETGKQRKRPDVERKDAAYLKAVKAPFSPVLPEYRSEKPPAKQIVGSLRRIGDMLVDIPEMEHRKQQLDLLAADAEKPLLLVVMGQFKTGKSSFINALLGQDALKVDVTPATAAVTMLVYGEKPEVIGHMRDGKEESFPTERLHALSAEGDEEGARLRAELSYLEVRLPIEMLRMVTIVDTPGLNADNPLHTQATEYFMERADQVLWVFSYAQAASRFDMASLQHIRNDLLPIGIVNRIDEHDPDEMDLDDFLESVKRKTGDRISHLVGVSAYMASQARASGDAALWEESRWGRLEALLEREVYAKGEQKKFVRVFSRMHDWFTELLTEVEGYAGEYDQAFAFVHDNEEAIGKLNGQLKEAKNFYQGWDGHSEKTALYHLTVHYPIPSYVEDCTKLNGQIRMMQSVYEKLAEERKSLDREGNLLQSEITQHNIAYKQLEKEYEEYNKSGMFGGTPLFDWDGTKKRLKAREDELNQKANVLNGRGAQLDRDNEAFSDRLGRNEKEALELSRTIAEGLRKAIERLEHQLENNEEAKQKALERMDELDWAPILRGKLQMMASWEIGSTIAEIERRFGGDGRVPEKPEDALRRMNELKQGISAMSAQAAAGAEAIPEAEPPAAPSGRLEELVAAASEGGVVTLPAGVYRIEKTLEIAKSMTLEGSGSDRTVLAGRLDTLLLLRGDTRLRLSGIGFDLEGHEGCILHATGGELVAEDCMFTGAKEAESADEDEQEPDYESTEGAALCAGLGVRLEVRGCLFKENTAALILHGNNHAVIHENTFANNRGGVVFLKESDGTLQRNEFVDNEIGVAAIGDSKPICRKNRFWGNVMGAYSGERAKPFYASNEFINNDRAGAMLTEESFTTLEGNTLRGNILGIAMIHSSGAYVYGNRSEANRLDGFSAETSGYVVAEYNEFVSNGRHGASSFGGGEFVFSHNRIENNLNHGLYGEGNARLEVSDNKLSQNRHVGLYLEGATTSVIERNECWLNMHGMIVAGTSVTQLKENDLMNRITGLLFTDKSQGTAERNRCHKNVIGLKAVDEANVKWIGNQAEQNKEAGIYVLDRASGVLEFNECVGNAGFGILNASEAKVDAKRNVCSRNEYPGIAYIGGANGTIESNRCDANGAGIRIVDQANVEIVNNDCMGNRNEGIGLRNSAQGRVRNNRCNGNEGEGIFVVEQASVHAEKNEARENQGCGIYFTDETTGAVLNNHASSNRAFGIYIDTDVRVRLKNNTTSFNKLGQIKEAANS